MEHGLDKENNSDSVMRCLARAKAYRGKSKDSGAGGGGEEKSAAYFAIDIRIVESSIREGLRDTVWFIKAVST